MNRASLVRSRVYFRMTRRSDLRQFSHERLRNGIARSCRYRSLHFLKFPNPASRVGVPKVASTQQITRLMSENI
jgi:hypothetical protein